MYARILANPATNKYLPRPKNKPVGRVFVAPRPTGFYRCCLYRAPAVGRHARYYRPQGVGVGADAGVAAGFLVAFFLGDLFADFLAVAFFLGDLLAVLFAAAFFFGDFFAVFLAAFFLAIMLAPSVVAPPTLGVWSIPRGADMRGETFSETKDQLSRATIDKVGRLYSSSFLNAVVVRAS
jgi:hypothetical protein